MEPEPNQNDRIAKDSMAQSPVAGGQEEAGGGCESCGAAVSTIKINVDGTTLLMESCDGCDARRWRLGGERIDLQTALEQVGQHAGRRRSRT